MTNEMINGSGSMSCKIENPAAIESIAGKQKTVSDVAPGRTLKSCRSYYRTGCIRHDLCERRDIEHCPVRTGFCQLIGESDTAYAIYKGMHECTPQNEAALRGRA